MSRGCNSAGRRRWGASASEISNPGSPAMASSVMARRSGNGAVEPSGLSGCAPTGANRMRSRFRAARAARATARWPRCGGSKLPPKKATRPPRQLGAGRDMFAYLGRDPFIDLNRNVQDRGQIQSFSMRFLIALLALAGGVVSYMALRVHYSTETQPCSINEKWDCGIVNHSPFAVIGPVPVAAIGIAGYVVLAGLALARRRRLIAGGGGSRAGVLALSHAYRKGRADGVVSVLRDFAGVYFAGYAAQRVVGDGGAAEFKACGCCLSPVDSNLR